MLKQTESINPESLGFKPVANEIGDALEKLLAKQISEEEFLRILSKHAESMFSDLQAVTPITKLPIAG